MSKRKKELYETSIELLNKAVGEELMSVHQYMYFHFHLDDQGLDLLANIFRRTAIEEMMHIEKYAERILFLGGDVIMKPTEDVKPITDVKGMLEWALDGEQMAVTDYNQWAMKCGEKGDSVTRKIFETVVEDEERHFSQFDDEMENLEKYGNNYLALQSMERSRVTGALAEPAPGGDGA